MSDARDTASGRESPTFEAKWLLAVSVALIALAWFPPIPVRGAQLGDAFGAGGVLLAVVVVARMQGLRPNRAWHGPAIALAMYAACAVVSMLVTSGSLVRVLGTWWLIALAAGCAAYALQGDEHALRLRRALVVAAVIGAVTGLTGAVLFWLGKPTVLLNHAGDLVPGDYPRIRGTMMRANGLAGILSIGLLLVGDMPRRWRVPIAVLLVAALVFTFSRSWIALAGASAVYLFALGGRQSRWRDAIAVLAVLGAAGAMLAVSWLNVALDPTRPWEIALVDGPSTRWVHLNNALDVIAANPLTGIGPGRTAALGWDAHFTVAQVAALMGIPAAVAFVTIVGFAVRRSVHAARRGNTAMRGVAAALVLCCLDALARDIEDQRAFWVLIGLALVARREGTR